MIKLMTTMLYALGMTIIVIAYIATPLYVYFGIEYLSGDASMAEGIATVFAVIFYIISVFFVCGE